MTPPNVRIPQLNLTLDELRGLTGLKQPKRIAAWLDARAWIHEPPRKRGDVPVVDRAYYLARMSGQLPGAAKKSRIRLDRM